MGLLRDRAATGQKKNMYFWRIRFPDDLVLTIKHVERNHLT